MIIRTLALVAALVVPAHPFTDSFDGRALNDDLLHRQGSGAVTYSHVAGQGSRVRDGVLALDGTVRMDAPSVGSTVAAKFTGDVTLALSSSANTTGEIIDIGLMLRANGDVQLVHKGQPVGDWNGTAPLRVSIDSAGRNVGVTINGARHDVQLATDVPSRVWIYLGGKGTVDDLHVSSLDSSALRKPPGLGLRYFGYRDPANLTAVTGHSNLNAVGDVLVGSADGFIVTDAASAAAVKGRHPGRKVLLIGDFAAEADWIGIREGCLSWEALEAKVTELERLGKELFLLPEGCPDQVLWSYLSVAEEHPRVAGLMVTGPSTEGKERVAARVLGAARVNG